MAYLGKTPSQAVRSRYYYTATGGETSLSGADDNSNVLTFTDGNYVDVSLNGATLVAGSDYNTTTTNTIGGLAALTASDIVEVLVYDTFSVFGGNMAANLNFKDNVKANFGTGSDLQIWHNGLDSYIVDNGTGDLILKGASNIKLQAASTNEDMVIATSNGAVTLYYDNSPKFATTSGGIDVTGTVTSDGFELNTLAIGGDTFGVVKSANNTAAGFDFFGDSSGTKGARVYYEGNGNLFTIAENTSGTIEPRLVIDDIGTLLVGKTSSAFGTAGVESSASGGIWSTRSVFQPASFNLLTNDGPIAAFYKDSALVGSIGARQGDLTIGTGTSGLQFYDATSEIFPVNISTNTSTDGIVTLGDALGRFKDLYLSGGVYLGGTGSANKLDDYEEGTWNVSVTGQSTNGSAGTAAGTYTKVGRKVTASVYFTCDQSPSGTNALFISGLPFATTINQTVNITIHNWDTSGVTGNGIVTPFIGMSFYGDLYSTGFYVRTTSTSGNPYYQETLLKTGSYIRFNVTYHTT